MQVILRIKKVELDLIKSGKKKREYRSPSKYNEKLLFLPLEHKRAKFKGNPAITEILFIAGFNADSPRCLIECLKIEPMKLTHDLDDEESNFHARAGQHGIRITLGNIIQ